MEWEQRRIELEKLAEEFAEAYADQGYLENYRHHLRAVLMKKYETKGHNAVSAQEREAYADSEYRELLEGLKVATEKAAKAKWKLEIAKMGLETWRTQQATRRAEMQMV